MATRPTSRKPYDANLGKSTMTEKFVTTTGPAVWTHRRSYVNSNTERRPLLMGEVSKLPGGDQPKPR